MAYNLNYNSGVEHENSLRRRRMIVTWTVILVVVVLAALIVLGFLYTRRNNDSSSVSGTITNEQRADLLNRMTATSTATNVFTKEEKQLSQDSSAKDTSDSSSSLSQSDRDKLLESMSGH